MRSFEEIKNKRELDKKWHITHEEFLYYKDKISNSSWWIVHGVCAHCGKKCSTNTKKLFSRKNEECKNLMFCGGSCASKVFSKTEEWARKNSEAQKKIQSLPEQKEKNRQGVLKSRSIEENYKKWYDAVCKSNADPEKNKKISETMKKLWKDEEYVNKVFKSSNRFHNSINGYFLSKYSGRIFFGSSYELYFLFMNDVRGNKIERFEGFISYELLGKKRRYIPDYVMNRYIYEIKSFYLKSKIKNGPEEIKQKFISAKKYVEENKELYDDYFLLEEKDLTKEYGEIWNRKYYFSWLLEDGFLEEVRGGKSLIVKRRDGVGRAKEAKEIYDKWNLLK